MVRERALLAMRQAPRKSTRRAAALSGGDPRHAALTIRIDFGAFGYLGPGKITLMELISKHGSISAAGKEMGMSYRRAWLLVDEINHIFLEPLVETQMGGPGGGGARRIDGDDDADKLRARGEAALLDVAALPQAGEAFFHNLSLQLLAADRRDAACWGRQQRRQEGHGLGIQFGQVARQQPNRCRAVPGRRAGVDGQGAVTFLVRVKENLEDPARLVLDL